MTLGYPKQPSCLSIGLGISLFVLATLSFFRIPDIVKYMGMTLMFIPAKLGIIEMVMPGDVVPIPIDQSPSTVMITNPGHYAFYTSNLDLLSINDAIAGTDTKPWLNMQAIETEKKVDLTMVERGLSFFDTPFARGRPVILFTIAEPGTYHMQHPTRPGDYMYLVPDVTTGKETYLIFVVFVEIVIVVGAVGFAFRKRIATNRQKRKEELEKNRARVEQTWEKRKEKQVKPEEDSSRWKRI